jgi:hypothetical protein
VKKEKEGNYEGRMRLLKGNPLGVGVENHYAWGDFL